MATQAVKRPAQGRTQTNKGQKDYGALRREFAQFLMDPFHGKQKAWAKEHGVNEATLSQWKADPEFAAQVKDWRAHAKVAIPDMLASVIRRVILKGDPRAFQAVMECLGEYETKGKLTVEGEGWRALLDSLREKRS